MLPTHVLAPRMVTRAIISMVSLLRFRHWIVRAVHVPRQGGFMQLSRYALTAYRDNQRSDVFLCAAQLVIDRRAELRLDVLELAFADGLVLKLQGLDLVSRNALRIRSHEGLQGLVRTSEVLVALDKDFVRNHAILGAELDLETHPLAILIAELAALLVSPQHLAVRPTANLERRTATALAARHAAFDLAIRRNTPARVEVAGVVQLFHLRDAHLALAEVHRQVAPRDPRVEVLHHRVDGLPVANRGENLPRPVHQDRAANVLAAAGNDPELHRLAIDERQQVVAELIPAEPFACRLHRHRHRKHQVEVLAQLLQGVADAAVGQERELEPVHDRACLAFGTFPGFYRTRGTACRPPSLAPLGPVGRHAVLACERRPMNSIRNASAIKMTRRGRTDAHQRAPSRRIPVRQLGLARVLEKVINAMHRRTRLQAAGAAQNGSHHDGQLRTVRVEHVANQVQLPVIPLLHRLPPHPG
uniref:Uncharacterized protein n=1 Tax=Ralstonia solanacearum TaxID=305 RepID=O82958_RALSL|nr:unnamed protein product [Ralstonia solanacearum]